MNWLKFILEVILKLFLGGSQKPTDPPLPPEEPPPQPVPPPDDNKNDSVLGELLRLHNEARVKNNLPALNINAKLQQAAQGHSKMMAQLRQMSHDLGGTTPSSRVTATGYKWIAMGENIAMGYTSAQSVFQGWMNSPGHRANILHPRYVDVGFGYEKSSNGQIYWTTDFGRPSNMFVLEVNQEFVSAPGGLIAGLSE